MKFILLLLSLSLSLLTLAQTPKTISYQGVARNATGQPIPNQPIKIKLSLVETATSTTSLYTETHTLSTTAQGLFAVQIGAGTVLSGTYATLDWSNGPKFVKTEIDPTGGDSFSLSSTNPLNAVPFALFAQSGTPGPQGPAGATGPQGPIGLTGPAGQTGATGLQGPAGLQGPVGHTGATGAQGPIGLTGPAGQTGATGPQGPIGPTGTTGSAGSNGKNALIRTTPEASGTNCVNGGIKIEAGLDTDGNGQLSDTEVNASQTKFLCNGATGTTGATGAQGPAGPAGGGFVHYVGEQFGGGVVFHVYRDASGTERGLVVSLTNQSDADWSNVVDQFAGASSSWDGQANSNTIINQAGHTNSAAKICLDYQLEGFGDWYLPSKDELYQLWQNSFNVNKTLSSINGAAGVFSIDSIQLFWSSTEFNFDMPWALMSNGTFTDFNNDTVNNGWGGKGNPRKVRAIRAYSVPSNSGSVTDLDGNTYETVTIGTQVWMKENLKVSKYRNGDAIPTNLSNSAWQNTSSGANAIYDNNPVNNSIYGKLYNWYSVADSRGLCPVGWHVPSDAEWKTLEISLGMIVADANLIGDRGIAQNVGGKLKSASLWNNPNTSATNESGFSGLPGGFRDNSGEYEYFGGNGYLWSSTETSTANAWFRNLNSNTGDSHRDTNGGRFGFSVRCLKD
jgi:uncharacterized protein (TIGR02145 family)